MNRQVNPDHCYVTDDNVVYMLEPVPGSPEWRVLKDGQRHQLFSSLAAAKGWLEHALGIDDGSDDYGPEGLNGRYEDSASYRSAMIDADRGRLIR